MLHWVVPKSLLQKGDQSCRTWSNWAELINHMAKIYLSLHAAVAYYVSAFFDLPALSCSSVLLSSYLLGPMYGSVIGPVLMSDWACSDE